MHHDADTTAAAHAHTTSPASAAPGPCQPSGSSSAAVPPQAAGYSLRRWQRWATGLFKARCACHALRLCPAYAVVRW